MQSQGRGSPGSRAGAAFERGHLNAKSVAFAGLEPHGVRDRFAPTTVLIKKNSRARIDVADFQAIGVIGCAGHDQRLERQGAMAGEEIDLKRERGRKLGVAAADAESDEQEQRACGECDGESRGAWVEAEATWIAGSVGAVQRDQINTPAKSGATVNSRLRVEMLGSADGGSAITTRRAGNEGVTTRMQTVRACSTRGEGSGVIARWIR